MINAEKLIKEAIGFRGRYFTYLDASEKMIHRLKSRYDSERVTLQSMFNTVRLYLEKAESELQ